MINMKPRLAGLEPRTSCSKPKGFSSTFLAVVHIIGKCFLFPIRFNLATVLSAWGWFEKPNEHNSEKIQIIKGIIIPFMRTESFFPESGFLWKRFYTSKRAFDPGRFWTLIHKQRCERNQFSVEILASFKLPSRTSFAD